MALLGGRLGRFYVSFLCAVSCTRARARERERERERQREREKEGEGKRETERERDASSLRLPAWVRQPAGVLSLFLYCKVKP